MSFSMFSSKTAVHQTASSPSLSLPCSSSPTATTTSYSDEPLPTSDPLEQQGSTGQQQQHGTSTTSIRQSYFSSFYHDHCFYLVPMLGWFLFSALLSSYNKLIFGKDGKIHFPCPLFMTSIHFLVQWACSQALCTTWPVYFGTNRVRRDMDWREWLSISVPCGLVTSGDVGLSNLSMVSISLTFYTMVKASTPIFVLFWAYLFGIERITWTLLLVVFIIAMGEYLTCLGEATTTATGTSFQWHGFMLCLGASILSGARWTLVQLKLQSLEPPLKTTVVTMRLLAPSMFFSLLIVSMIIEQPWIKLLAADDDDDDDSNNSSSLVKAVETLALGLLGAFFAINMVLFEFYLIMHASALLLMIGGVVKEMLTIVVGVVFFKDPINATNMAGCFVVFLGVLLYKVSFHLDKDKKNKHKLHPKRASLERTDSMSSNSNSSHHNNATNNHNNSSVPNSPMRAAPNRERITPVAADLQDHERTGLVHSISKSSDMNGDGGAGSEHEGFLPSVPSFSTSTGPSLRQQTANASSSSSSSSAATAKEQWIPSYRNNQQESGIEMRRSSSGDDRLLD